MKDKIFPRYTTLIGGLLVVAMVLVLSFAMTGSAGADAEVVNLAHYTSCAFNTGNNATVALPSDIDVIGNVQLEVGDEVAIFSHDGTICAGAQAWDGSNIVITAWGDDSQTAVVDGLVDHEIMQFRFWDTSAGEEHVVKMAVFSQGDEYYAANAFPAVSSLHFASDLVYVSSTEKGNVGGIFYADEDIILYNPWIDEWFKYFDGSDLGFKTDVNAFTVLDDGSILLSLFAAVTLPDVGAVSGSDIIRFTPSPTSNGNNTSGTFSWYFDGSDVGLDVAKENIDSIGFAPDGKLVISTTGVAQVPGIATKMNDEDLLAFDLTQEGETTAGTWSVYFDGSDVELVDDPEDISAVWIDSTTEEVYLSTYGAVTVTGASGDEMDIIRCVPGTLGATTSCTYNQYWDGQTYGLGAEIVDGLMLKSVPTAHDVVAVSSDEKGNIGGLFYADEDIIVYDPWTESWFKYFDASDVGLKTDVNAFAILDDGDILLSLQKPATLPDVGSVDDSDIIRFRHGPTSTGNNTNGTFSWYFDGSDVDLEVAKEDIDAIGFAPDGKLVISTAGAANVTDIAATMQDEDLMAFDATKLGDETEGTWIRYFDGSDVELADDAEDIGALWIDSGTEDIYLSTYGAVTVTGASGDGLDIIRCVPGTLGRDTTCTYNLYWDGSTYGFGVESMDGISLFLASGSPYPAKASNSDKLQGLSTIRQPKD